MAEPMIRHNCPADGSEHEASADCACNPAKLSDTEWLHFGKVGQAFREAGDYGTAAFQELNDALALGGRA